MAALRNPPRLAIDVSIALPQPYCPDYNKETFVQWAIEERAVAAAQRGVGGTAQEAYRTGCRAGERHGHWTAAMDIRDALDAKSQRRHWEPEHRWRRDTADHAQQRVVDANQEVVRARVHDVSTVSLAPLLRKGVTDWSKVPGWAGKGRPEIAAFAYDLGRRTSMRQAYTFTENSIEQDAYHRAADLGVSLKLVDADMGRSPGRRPAGFTEPAEQTPRPQPGSHPSAAARSSFAAPASATPIQSSPANGAAYVRGPASKRAREWQVEVTCWRRGAAVARRSLCRTGLGGPRLGRPGFALVRADTLASPAGCPLATSDTTAGPIPARHTIGVGMLGGTGL